MITIELNDDDALVLFDLLARMDDLDNVSSITELSFEDPAEKYALWQFHGALERTVVAPFRDDYRDLVGQARKAVRARWGASDGAA